MIELDQDSLVFTFPDIHSDAELRITFQRTLRIPDDDMTYPLPPGLGEFPLRHVDDYSDKLPEAWITRGGVLLPMYQSEALWISFSSAYLVDHQTEYPFAVKVATGKINAITGSVWGNELKSSPQDYVVIPDQLWIDGYCFEKGLIRQFIAMPLGAGYSAEEQLTGTAEHGGIQIIVYPMKRDIFNNLFPEKESEDEDFICYALEDTNELYSPDMSLAPGGKMHQEIYEDQYGINSWNQNVMSRCFIHLANSLAWRSITGEHPPTTPLSAKDYEKHGLPWFSYYNETLSKLEGSDEISKLKSVAKILKDQEGATLPENESISIQKIIDCTSQRRNKQVRESDF